MKKVVRFRYGLRSRAEIFVERAESDIMRGMVRAGYSSKSEGISSVSCRLGG